MENGRSKLVCFLLCKQTHGFYVWYIYLRVVDFNRKLVGILYIQQQQQQQQQQQHVNREWMFFDQTQWFDPINIHTLKLTAS